MIIKAILENTPLKIDIIKLKHCEVSFKIIKIENRESKKICDRYVKLIWKKTWCRKNGWKSGRGECCWQERKVNTLKVRKLMFKRKKIYEKLPHTKKDKYLRKKKKNGHKRYEVQKCMWNENISLFKDQNEATHMLKQVYKKKINCLVYSSSIELQLSMKIQMMVSPQEQIVWTNNLNI